MGAGSVTRARLPEALERLIQLRQRANTSTGGFGAGGAESAYLTELAYRTALYSERYGELRIALDALLREVAAARDAVEHDQAQRRGLL